MSENRGGPDLDNLRKLHGMLPSLVQGLEEKRIGGQGSSTASRKPTKLCIICCATFDFKITQDSKMDEGICDPCWAHLQDGCCACIHGDFFAFMKSSNLGDMAGKVVEISDVEMAQIAKQFKLQKRVQQHHNDDQQPEAADAAQSAQPRLPPVA